MSFARMCGLPKHADFNWSCAGTTARLMLTLPIATVPGVSTPNQHQNLLFFGKSSSYSQKHSPRNINGQKAVDCTFWVQYTLRIHQRFFLVSGEKVFCSETGYFQHPTDCSAFIACIIDHHLSKPVMNHMRCPKGEACLQCRVGKGTGSQLRKKLSSG